MTRFYHCASVVIGEIIREIRQYYKSYDLYQYKVVNKAQLRPLLDISLIDLWILLSFPEEGQTSNIPNPPGDRTAVAQHVTVDEDIFQCIGNSSQGINCTRGINGICRQLCIEGKQHCERH